MLHGWIWRELLKGTVQCFVNLVRSMFYFVNLFFIGGNSCIFTFGEADCIDTNFELYIVTLGVFENTNLVRPSLVMVWI